MEDIALILVEAVSAIICFFLLWFMIKPYRVTGESRYIGLPLGFAFLGASYVFMGLSLYFESFRFVEEIKWLQLFTEAYAFAFLATMYFFSKKPSERSRLWLNLIYAGLVFAAVISYLVVFEDPVFALPIYKTVQEYFKIFNIICLAYISFYTLRSHASNPDPKTIWIPFAYLLLSFSQYSFLIWSIDSSYAAYIGAHFLRLAFLVIFLFVSYRAFYVPLEKPRKMETSNEETAA